MKTSAELLTDCSQQTKALVEAFPGITAQVNSIATLSFAAGYAKCQEGIRKAVESSAPSV